MKDLIVELRKEIIDTINYHLVISRGIGTNKNIREYEAAMIRVTHSNTISHMVDIMSDIYLSDANEYIVDTILKIEIRNNNMSNEIKPVASSNLVWKKSIHCNRLGTVTMGDYLEGRMSRGYVVAIVGDDVYMQRHYNIDGEDHKQGESVPAHLMYITYGKGE